MAKSKSFKKERASEIRALIQAAARQHTLSALKLADLLSEVFYGVVEDLPLFQHWGHKTFHDYVENELGMHGKTALRYVRVFTVLIVEKELKTEDLPSGISKLYQLSRVATQVPKAELMKWLTKARRMSCCALEEAVEQEFGSGLMSQPISFYVRRSEIKAIRRALEEWREDLGTTTLGETLTAVVLGKTRTSKGRSKAA